MNNIIVQMLNDCNIFPLLPKVDFTKQCKLLFYIALFSFLFGATIANK
jgi:hypothetical protein